MFAVPVIDESTAYITVSSASMLVDFHSIPMYESVEIFAIPQNVNGFTHPPALSNGSADNQEIFWTISELGDTNYRRYQLNLTIPDIRENHLHDRYLVSVRNSVGNAAVAIKLEYPSLGW